MRFPSPGWTLADEASGRVVAVHHLVFDLTFDVIAEFVPFAFKAYADAMTKDVRQTVATARVDLGNFKGDLLMIHDPERGAQIVIQPDRVVAKARP